MRQRIITAVCLLAFVVPFIYLGGYFVMGLGLLGTAIATKEMIDMHEKLVKVPVVIKILTVIATLGIVLVPTLAMVGIIAISHLLLLLLCSFLKKITANTVAFYALILAYIGFSFRALLGIRAASLTLFVFLLALVILTDSAAYFTGKFFGKSKLAPKISPNKTVEGAIGGLLIGALVAIGFNAVANLFTQTWILSVLAFGLPITSQFGDLFASSLKRKYDVKDYGKIFPGHGGVMDRLDSLVLAGIVLYVILYFSGSLAF